MFGTPSGHSFGGSFGAAFDESPTTTPITILDKGERTYFHTRDDSITSEGSIHSVGVKSGSIKSGSIKSGSIKSGSLKSSIATTPSLVAHSSTSSIATTSHSVQSRKSSFASIRNAFKGKGTDVPPPLPTLEQHPYPHALKNPVFPRSNSSLAHSSPRGPSFASNGGFSLPPRPSTPSGDNRGRQVPKRSASLSRTGHSQSGSIFYMSDGGSDSHFAMESSPPPVPKMPNGLMNNSSNVHPREYIHTSSHHGHDEHKPVLKEPRTPAEYALHAVFTRFVLSADHKVTQYLKSRLVCSGL